MVRKMRDIRKDLRKLGFTKLKGRGSGDHELWRYPGTTITITLDGKDSDDAHRYNEDDLRRVTEELERQGLIDPIR